VSADDGYGHPWKLTIKDEAEAEAEAERENGKENGKEKSKGGEDQDKGKEKEKGGQEGTKTPGMTVGCVLVPACPWMERKWKVPRRRGFLFLSFFFTVPFFLLSRRSFVGDCKSNGHDVQIEMHAFLQAIAGSLQ
jgi:hypothetical protein